MRHSILFFVIILIFPLQKARSPVLENFWIVWNVGQGQWITQVTNQNCRHFDFGGEPQYFKSLQKSFLAYCQDKFNLLYLSHPDLDHYSFLNLIVPRVKSVCWMVHPESFQPQNLKISMCGVTEKNDFSKKNTRSNQTIITECIYKDKNSCSTVAKRGVFLIPGDSPKSQEKHWVPLLENSDQIKVLILGHHGSRTSTGKELLKKLSHIKMAIASARKKKYGHPHFQTQQILKQFHRPLIRTESWGNLVFL